MNNKNTNTNEQRFKCENWDAEKQRFVVNIKGHGKGRHPARKVLTKGVRTIWLGSDTVKEIVMSLRHGYEVRFLDFGTHTDVIRLFPMMSADLKTMLVKADTMGMLRTDTLSDKKAVFTRRGSEVSAETVKAFAEDRLSQTPSPAYAAQGHRNYAYVTPDTVVTCPKCGYSFRVGRKNSEQ